MNDRIYQVSAGTYYHPDTPEEVIGVLDRARYEGFRVRVWLGDTTTGRAWPEEHTVTGHIGRSTGEIKVPLLIHNAACIAGPALLDHCIVRVDRIGSRETVYQHPTFDAGKWETRGARIYHNDSFWGRCKNPRRAMNLCLFMLGHRYAT